MNVFINFKKEILVPSKDGWETKSNYLLQGETAENFVTDVMNEESSIRFFCLVVNDAQVQIALDNITSFTIFYT